MSFALPAIAEQGAGDVAAAPVAEDRAGAGHGDAVAAAKEERPSLPGDRQHDLGFSGRAATVLDLARRSSPGR